MAKILCHACCAPCFMFLKDHLTQEFKKTVLFFKNPNIHPFTEFEKRLNCLESFAGKNEISLIKDTDYNVTEFLREIVFREKNRCLICVRRRLYSAARLARASKFNMFTTTMLASLRMDHELVKNTGLAIEKELKIKFYYHDFRKYKKRAYALTEENKLYKQKYCGCIYSEEERFKKPVEKIKKACKI